MAVLLIASFYFGRRKWLGLFYCIFKWGWDRHRFNPNCWSGRVPRLTRQTKQLSQRNHCLHRYTADPNTTASVRRCKWKTFWMHVLKLNPNWDFFYLEDAVWKQMLSCSCCRDSSLTLRFCTLFYQHCVYLWYVCERPFCGFEGNKGKVHFLKWTMSSDNS